MTEKASDVRELSSIYLDILHKLNSINTPEWLHLDLTFQQIKVLYILKQNGPLKMSELHRKLGVSMPTITGIVNRLIERRDGKALIARDNSPEDRREVWAKLTDAGAEVTNMVGELNPRLLEAALVTMNEEDLQNVKLILGRLNEAVEQHFLNSSNGLNNASESFETAEVNSRRVRRNIRRQPIVKDSEPEELVVNGSSSVTSANATRFLDPYNTRPIIT